MLRWLVQIFLLQSAVLFAQISQPARWEAENKFSDEAYSIISLKEEGLALIRDLEKYNNRNKVWEIVYLDSSLNSVWTTKAEIDMDLKFLGYEHLPGRINLMFRKSQTDNLIAEILDIQLNDGVINHWKTEMKFQMRITHYTVVEQSCIFGGYVGNEPVIAIHNPIKNSNFVLPGFLLADAELLDVRPNSNSTFSILLFQKIQGKKKLIFRTFDKDGNILVEDEIPVEDNKTILSAATSILQHDEIMIAGAYSYRNEKQASGIFSFIVDPFSDQSIRYEEFPQFNHFLDYLPDRKAGKIKEKNSKRSSEKAPSYKVNVGIHRVEEFKNGFAVFGESYIISSSNSNYSAFSNPYYYSPTSRMYGNPYSYQPFTSRYYNNPYSYYPYSPNSSTVPSEMHMLEGFVIAYDFNGKRLWDYSIPMNELKAPSLEQVSDFSIENNIPHFLYKTEESLKFSSHAVDSAEVNEPSSIPIKLMNEGEHAKDGNELEGNVRHWYGRYFYVWGVQTIKDSMTGSINKSRRVFFINKIELD